MGPDVEQVDFLIGKLIKNLITSLQFDKILIVK